MLVQATIKLLTNKNKLSKEYLIQECNTVFEISNGIDNLCSIDKYDFYDNK